MRRTVTAAEDLPDSTAADSSSAEPAPGESTTALIARLSAELGLPPVESTGQRRHRAAPDAGGAVVSRHAVIRSRSTVRRYAPLAVGAVVVLVATVVLTTVRSSSTNPTELAGQTAATSAEPTTSEDAEPFGMALAAPSVASLPTTLPSAVPTTSAAKKPATTAPAGKPQTAARKPTAQAAAPRPAGSAGDGTQAATAHGWTLATADEFTGATLSSHWGAYDGPGNGGDGRRTPDAISVQNGIMTIRGDSDGTTGGMAWSDDQRFGKWEVRARFPSGDRQYHPVLLLWPQGEWPDGGEVDFAETTSASSDVEFFLHYSSSNKQKSGQKGLDLTQWHNYAVEWVDGRVTGFIDGQQWFESTESETVPPGQMHLAIQLDYFPKGGSPRPSQMDVDYVRIYR